LSIGAVRGGAQRSIKRRLRICAARQGLKDRRPKRGVGDILRRYTPGAGARMGTARGDRRA